MNGWNNTTNMWQHLDSHHLGEFEDNRSKKAKLVPGLPPEKKEASDRAFAMCVATGGCAPNFLVSPWFKVAMTESTQGTYVAPTAYLLRKVMKKMRAEVEVRVTDIVKQLTDDGIRMVLSTDILTKHGQGCYCICGHFIAKGDDGWILKECIISAAPFTKVCNLMLVRFRIKD
eukprot:GHVU01126686.1.p2 GENE.GHVU01126686.1~~GHVU01126686.1.p2  ORF type:complete len:173 (-),score=24.40 GHVU01126686.1:4171-4689(-)